MTTLDNLGAVLALAVILTAIVLWFAWFIYLMFFDTGERGHKTEKAKWFARNQFCVIDGMVLDWCRGEVTYDTETGEPLQHLTWKCPLCGRRPYAMGYGKKTVPYEDD